VRRSVAFGGFVLLDFLQHYQVKIRRTTSLRQSGDTATMNFSLSKSSVES